jgi:gluconokinase
LPAGLWRYCIDHRRVVLGAAYSSGGQLFSWALSLWEGAPTSATGTAGGAAGGSGASAHELHYDVAMPVGAGSEGVLVMPWHAGTRPPEPGVPGGQGGVLGLGLGHTGAHIVSAAVEAVCFQLANGLDDLERVSEGPLEIVANGGALDRSPWWKQRLASAIGRPVHYPSAPETTARGAAALALGVEVGDEEAEGELVDPRPDEVAALRRTRRRWDNWYQSLLPIAGAEGTQRQD